MPGFNDLAREYEARRFPLTRQLDVHGEGPQVARDRALHWIQSFAHETPGAELLLIVERGVRPGRPATPVRKAVEALLGELNGRLVEWWQSFGPGSLVVRVALVPRMGTIAQPHPVALPGDGRTADTAGAAPLAAHHDIPDYLLDVAHQVAELRRVREGLSVGLTEVILRRIWIEVQATAMQERIPFETALARAHDEERSRILEE